jgi:hypothetical protein
MGGKVLDVGTAVFGSREARERAGQEIWPVSDDLYKYCQKRGEELKAPPSSRDVILYSYISVDGATDWDRPGIAIGNENATDWDRPGIAIGNENATDWDWPGITVSSDNAAVRDRRRFGIAIGNEQRTRVGIFAR